MRVLAKHIIHEVELYSVPTSVKMHTITAVTMSSYLVMDNITI